MSVPGEFQRVLGESVALLERSESAGARSLAARLADAGLRGREDLSDGAALVVDLLESPEPRPTAPGLESQEFDQRAEHLRSICRAILGR